MSYAEFNAIIEQLRKGEISREQAEVLLTALKPVEITEHEGDKQRVVPQPVNTGHIAIIGMSGQFPGAETIEQFWQNLVSGVDAITELPKCYQTEAPKPGALTQGGFLAKRACFDAWFFNIPPKEAEAMHPHQRLVLQEGWKALEDAGINPKRLANTATGVFIGAEPVAYFHDSFTGSSEAIIASRLAYFLNLKGPALVINTGCSSSGVAIHSACQSLNTGESDLALAGGVFAMLDQHMLNSLTNIGMVATNARCRSFDANADGTVFSEGVGIVVLKRLADAIADQDPIYAVITASGINQDGTSNGITAPNGHAQTALIEQLYQRHRINPEAISYVEAHGTGTTLGDPVEANALVRAFRSFTNKQAFCALGSAKAHIGHTSASAAVIGLIKLVLSMQHRRLPKLLHFQQLNPLIELTGSPFYLPAETQAWQPSGDNQLLVAALSSFGHSGTNVHIVVSEFGAEPLVNKALAEYIIPISAKTPESLRAYTQKLADFISVTKSLDLADLAYTLQVGREAMVERAAFVCTNLTHLQQQLIAFSQGEILTGIYSAVVSEPLALTDLPVQAALTEIAQVWVEGRLRDWPCWYGEVKPKRIHAPVYQFAEEAYWATAKPVVSTSDYLHPLLHKNCSDINGLCYQSEFTGNEFYLAGHSVQGVKVLPGVAHLELAIASLINGLAQSSSFIALDLQQVAWLKPLALKHNGLRVFTRLTPDTAQRFRFTVEGLTDTGETECYSQGLATLLTMVEHKTLALTQLRERMADNSVSVEQCYARFRQAGIVHGDELSALKKLYCDGESVLAHIVLPESLQESFEHYYWHPSLLDSVLQATIGFSLAAAHASDETVLPFTVEHCQWFKPLQTSLWCWLTKTESLAGVKFDIEMCLEDGSVCARLNGFNARPVQASSDKTPILDSVEQEYLIAPVWQPLLNAELLRQALVAPDVVINATPEQVAKLQAWYPSLRTINLPKQASLEHISELLGATPIHHLLWFANNSSDATVIEPQTSVLQLFHISKALLSLGFATHPLTWTLVTENCASVPGFTLKPTHASVHGFIGSLAKELPHWRLRLFDVDDATQLPQDLFTLAELPAGEVFAYRDSQWWQLVLKPWLSPTPLMPITPWYKQRGVYVVLGGAGGIGMAWSRYVIENFQARVVWLGRKPLCADINAKLAEFAHYDVPPWYITADAKDKASLLNAYQLIKRRYPDINGVVHSAIVLQDQSVASMTEQQFMVGLSAKVDTSVNLAEVFGDEALDFMLFFSSIIAFGKAAGQSNYAAGSTFKDVFALSLAQQKPYPVKIMNWGYWGTVGIVASAEYRQRMQRVGLGSITPEQGMAGLNQLLAAPLPQLAMLVTENTKLLPNFELAWSLSVSPQSGLVDLMSLEQRLQTDAFAISQDLLKAAEPIPASEALLARLLLAQLVRFGLKPGLTFSVEQLKQQLLWLELYDKWFAESFALLTRAGLLECVDAGRYRIAEDYQDNPWQDWQANSSAWLANPLLKPMLDLVQPMLKALPAILAGHQTATSVMFPGGSMALVETIYQANPIADYFNDVVAIAVREFMTLYLAQQQTSIKPIRILEVGAGTGGTTAKILPILSEFEPYIAEYCYTDVSEAFLNHGVKQYGSQRAWFRTALFDVEVMPDSQGLTSGYDLIIATNVLHATRQIRTTLAHVKALLAGQGVLILNEMSVNPISGHLSFGLLKGWWLAEDAELRLPGSPALSTASWLKRLAEVGFYRCLTPVEHAHALGNQIIIAQSDGVIRRLATHKAIDKPAILEQPIQTHRSDSSLFDATVLFLRNLLSDTLKIPVARLDPAKELEAYGIDSILVIQLSTALGKQLTGISTTLFFEYRSLNALAEHLVRHRTAELIPLVNFKPLPDADVKTPLKPKLVEPSTSAVTPRSSAITSWLETPPDIAVIGLAGRYPEAETLEQFWDNLAQGKHCIREIPAQRWDWRQFYDAEKGREGFIYSKWGGFIDAVENFDTEFFNISPREAELMDPQERLFLQTCYHCLEDAGYTPNTISTTTARKIGVFVGVMNSGYAPLAAHASIANRVSYSLDFYGPSLAIDTACSSSLSALQLALDSLYSGSSECALAGGVNLIVNPMQYQRLSALTVLSAGNSCKSFGAGADGIVDGEGVGVVLLKPLAQALRDNDRIYGVIKAARVNAGGKTNGYTVPNPRAQAALIADTLRLAKIDARTLSYIEAHGTGTALGDPIEIAGLTQAFADYTHDTQFCAIGSAKSNIGHCESAAGIAGLTKVLLQMQHGLLAPSLHADELNPAINFEHTPFIVNRVLTPWERPVINGKTYPRLAGISSFGAGGANAHVIVEEYIDERVGDYVVDNHAEHLIVLSAKTSDRLLAQVEQLLVFLKGQAVELAQLAYTLQVGRVAMAQRFAVTVRSLTELKQVLSDFIAHFKEQKPLPAGCYLGEISLDYDIVNAFEQDPDLQATLSKWFIERRYAKLLALWVKGLNIDWRQFYQLNKPQPIRLPGYPFADERYWRTPQVAVEKVRPAWLHPLVQHNISTFERQAFKSVFNGNEFFLNDHRVNGQAYLPGVAYLEMARAAMAESLSLSESQSLTLTDITWLKPIIVTSATTVVIELSVQTPDSILFEIKLIEQEQAVLCCQGRASTVALSHEQIPLAAINRAGAIEYSAEQCYQAYTRIGIDYGPAQQGLISVIRLGDDCLAKLHLPNAVSETLDTYVLHPSLADSALQATIAYMLAGESRLENPALPFALTCLDILAPCTANMWAWIQPHKAAQQSGVVKTDVTLCDEQGHVCARLIGLTARTLNPTIQIKSEAILRWSIPVWDNIDFDRLKVIHQSQHTVVFNATSAQQQQLHAFLPNAHYANDRDYSIQSGQEAVIYFAQNNDDDLIAAQETGVITLFKLIKQLLASGYAVTELALTVITVNAQTVRVNDAIQPAHTAMHGLLGSLAKEYPHWQVRVLDMDNSVWPWQQMLNLPAHTRGDVWAYRGAEWYQQLLLPAIPPTRSGSVFRSQAVYVVIGGAGGLGYVLTEYLIKQYQARVIWLGRRPLDKAIQQKIEQLAQLGTAPSYLQADASKLSDLQDAYQRIIGQYSQINGVIHSAIVLKDQSLANMSEIDFRAALSAKVNSTVNMAHVFGALALDFMVFFSSAIAFEKVPGQSNYAAGTVFTDSFAQALAKQAPYPVKIINWGYWGSVGIVSSHDYQQKMTALGLASIEPEEGMAVLETVLASEVGQVSVVKTL